MKQRKIAQLLVIQIHSCLHVVYRPPAVDKILLFIVLYIVI